MRVNFHAVSHAELVNNYISFLRIKDLRFMTRYALIQNEMAFYEVMKGFKGTKLRKI